MALTAIAAMALACTSCGKDQLTATEPSTEPTGKSSAALDNQAQVIRSLLEKAPNPDAARVLEIFSSGSASGAPALEDKLSAWVEAHKGSYPIARESLYKDDNIEWERVYTRAEGAKALVAEIAPASETPMANNGVLVLRSSPALLIRDAKGAILRRYGLLSISSGANSNLLTAVSFENGILHAFYMSSVTGGLYLGFGALNAFNGIYVTIWWR